MKSRYEFGTDEQYYEYLVHYYVGQAMSGAMAIVRPYGEAEEPPISVIDYAKAIVKCLKSEHESMGRTK